ncbi:MAG TPA: hypothetical protein DCM07_23935 [Planctomycetaceae bacterium]|nr:hypothetical protein [Planctomycetaceae bacterium]
MQFEVVADNRKLSEQSHNPEQQSQPVRLRGCPMCQPAWRGSTRHHAQWEQMRHFNQKFRTRKARKQP